MSTSTASAPAEGEKLSTIQRLVNMFVAPSKTFTDLNRDSSWWAAWLLIAVFAAIFIFAMQQQVGFEQITRNEIAANPRATEQLDKQPAEVRERQIQISTSFTRGFSYATPIMVLIIGVIIAAVLLGTFNFGLGAEMKFGTVLAVIFYSWVPGIIKSLLAAVSLFAGADPEGFNVRNPAATNIGFFISRTDHPVLHSLGSALDIFAIWYIILMGIGFACVSKVKRGTATWVVAGWYIFITLCGTAWIAFTAS